jgi:biotin operon repressor
MKIITTLLLTLIILISCKQTTNIADKKNIDYSNKTVLDSLIKSTSQSKDTLFLGFVIGMSKTTFKNHIEKIKNDGKTITFSKSNRYSSIAGAFDLGAGYTFETSISAEYAGKTITGLGKYFLEPIYNKNGELSQLNILATEDWSNSGSSIDEPNWLKNKIEEKYEESTNESLKKALVDNEIISEYNKLWQKENLIIYETSMTINYVDLKTQLVELLVKELEKEIIKKGNKDVKI